MTHPTAQGSSTPAIDHPRRRRPVGEPPPLPRDLHGSARLWIITAVLLIAAYAWGKTSPTAGEFQRWLDATVGAHIPNLSAGRFAATGRNLAGTAGLWLLFATRWGIAIALIVWKRWRHLAVFVGSVAVVTIVVRSFPTAGLQPSTPKHASYAAASLAVTVMGIVYGLVPVGRSRRLALIVSAAVCVFLAAFSILTRKPLNSGV